MDYEPGDINARLEALQHLFQKLDRDITRAQDGGAGDVRLLGVLDTVFETAVMTGRCLVEVAAQLAELRQVVGVPRDES